MLKLVSLELKNFRSIEHAFIDFDQTTVLIGENGSGKSTLIEALCITLDPRLKDKAPEFQQFHFRRNLGNTAKHFFINIRFKLSDSETLEEEELLNYFPIRSEYPGPKASVYEFTFTSYLFPTEIRSEWSCKNIHDGAKSEDPKLLGLLRLMIPVIHLRPGALIGNIKSNFEDNKFVIGDRDHFKDLKERINLAVMDILLERTSDSEVTVNKGFAAVKELAAAISEATGRAPTESGFALRLREMLEMFTVIEGENLLSALNRLEEHTEKMGALMLVNALILGTRNKLERYSRPVLIFEQPEVFLHTKTLATIRRLVNKIKWQKIVTTNSGMLLSTAPLKSIRRIRKRNGQIVVNKLRTEGYSNEDLRRIYYHLNARHTTATFARFWILVEGESEHWIIPQLASIMDREFQQEGIAVLDFAQIGLKPLIKYANELGINWHVLVDGDEAGVHYEEMALSIAEQCGADNPVTKLSGIDIEHYFWEQGMKNVYLKYAKATKLPPDKVNPSRIIRKAIKNTSKPFLALSIIESIAQKGPDAIPDSLRQMIANCIEIARQN